MNEGYIKLWRKLKKSFIFQNSEMLHVWLEILLTAAHKDTDVLIGMQKLVCKRGSLITGRLKLAKNLRMHDSKIERILKLFEIEQLIEQQKTTKYRIITVVNWEQYQQCEQQNEQQMNNKRTTNEQQVNTNKNVKNVKNKYIYLHDDSFPENAELPKLKSTRQTKKEFIPPTLDDVKSFFKEKGYSEQHAEKVFDYYAVNDWKDSHGKQVQNWKQKMIGNWLRKEEGKINNEYEANKKTEAKEIEEEIERKVKFFRESVQREKQEMGES